MNEEMYETHRQAILRGVIRDIAQTKRYLKTSVGVEHEELLAGLREQERLKAGIENRTIDTRRMLITGDEPEEPDYYGYDGYFGDDEGNFEGARGD